MIEDIINYCKDNISMIVVLLLQIIVFIGSLVNSKNGNSTVLLSLMENLPVFISEAEDSGANGTQKFTLVFSRSVVYLASLLGISEQKVVCKYATLISTAIENILSTPEKKG